MSFGEGLVNFDALLCCSFRFRKKLGRNHLGTEDKGAVCVRESSIGEGIVWVDLNRLLEIRNAFLDFLWCQLENVETSFEVELIRFGICGVVFRHPLLDGLRQPRAQLL